MFYRLLFLCTGNYYRSRYAEILFNHLAAGSGLNWAAGSRAIALELGFSNVGPISGHTLQALAANRIPAPEANRYPLQLLESNLLQADRIIAMHEAEHRPMLGQRFPGWVERVEFWNVPDLEEAPVGQALADIDRRVRGLVQRLANSPPPSPAWKAG